jgi:hypothetical protein
MASDRASKQQAEIDAKTVTPETKYKFDYDFTRGAKTDHILSQLNSDEADKFKINVWMIEKILSSHELFVSIPNYVNSKPTQVNIALIKTALAILVKGYLSLQQIHEVVMAFDIKTKQMATDCILPLTEKVIGDTLRPIGYAIPQSLFTMWTKKCLLFLDCHKIEYQKKYSKKKYKPTIISPRRE